MCQIYCRLHRLNNGWTRTLFSYTTFEFLITSQAPILKIHFAFFFIATITRIRDKGDKPTVNEIFILIFGNNKLSKLFTPETYHVINFDQEWDEGRTNALLTEYQTNIVKNRKYAV